MLATVHSRDYALTGGGLDPTTWSALLAPIPGDNPAGEFLRHEGTYDRIAEARREEDERLDQGVWQREIKRADWVAVAQLCGEALELRTKDVQIAAWLTEAWCRLRGFAGLNAGLRLIAALYETYWDSLYPPLEDADYRIAPFHWINEKLAWELQFVPLTQPVEPGSRAYAWADWESANRAHQHQLQHPESKSSAPSSAPAPAQIQKALRLSPPEFIAANLEQIAQAAAIAVEIERFLESRLATAGPSLRQLRVQLQQIEQWLGEVQVSLPPSVPPPPASTVAPDATSAASAPARPLPAGPAPQGREEAYRQLADIAAFLMRTEPHSPTPYLILRAIRWGSLPLDQLLPELVRNEGALGELQQLLNLQNR